MTLPQSQTDSDLHWVPKDKNDPDGEILLVRDSLCWASIRQWGTGGSFTGIRADTESSIFRGPAGPDIESAKRAVEKWVRSVGFLLCQPVQFNRGKEFCP